MSVVRGQWSAIFESRIITYPFPISHLSICFYERGITSCQWSVVGAYFQNNLLLKRSSHLSIPYFLFINLYLPIYNYLQSFIVSGFGQSGLPDGHLIKNGIGTSVQYDISLSSLYAHTANQ